MAGLTVAAVAVPQAMAYAQIAGLRPEFGLYTAIVMTAVGALFDSSRQLINGPTNAISIAVLSALVGFGDADQIHAAVLLAFLVGAIQMGITLLRLGDLTRYVSHAVIVGFTLGAAVLIVLDQIKNLLGLHSLGTGDDHFLKRFWMTLQHIDQTNRPTLLIGMGTVVVALVVRFINTRLRIRLPELLLAVIAMAVTVWAWGLDHKGVAIIGKIPAALPSFELPALGWNNVRRLASSSLAIALLGLLEALAMAKAIAARTGQKLDINQQCLSEGVANLAGSLFQCFPGSGSLTRSTINQQAGAVTQWSGVICGRRRRVDGGLIRPLRVLHSQVGARGDFDPFGLAARRPAPVGLPPADDAFRRVDRRADGHLRRGRVGGVLHFDRGRAYPVCAVRAACGAGPHDRADPGARASDPRTNLDRRPLQPHPDLQPGRRTVLRGRPGIGRPSRFDHRSERRRLTGCCAAAEACACCPDAVCLSGARPVHRTACADGPRVGAALRSSSGFYEGDSRQQRPVSAGLGPEQVFACFQETGGGSGRARSEAVQVRLPAFVEGDTCETCPRHAESLQNKEGWYYMI